MKFQLKFAVRVPSISFLLLKWSTGWPTACTVCVGGGSFQVNLAPSEKSKVSVSHHNDAFVSWRKTIIKVIYFLLLEKTITLQISTGHQKFVWQIWGFDWQMLCLIGHAADAKLKSIFFLKKTWIMVVTLIHLFSLNIQLKYHVYIKINVNRLLLPILIQESH